MFNNNFSNNFYPYYNFPYGQNGPNQNCNKQNIINKILYDPDNYFCFDCHQRMNALNYCDLKNAVFLCYNCCIQHLNMPKEISEVKMGNVAYLDEKYLLPLYHGGNRNLWNFITFQYPLLEKLKIRRIYSNKAMDYYRKLLQSKINNTPKPKLPSKFEAYDSIYKEIIFPENEDGYSSLRNSVEEEKRNDLFIDNIYNGFSSQNKYGGNEDEKIWRQDEKKDIKKIRNVLFKNKK